MTNNNFTCPSCKSNELKGKELIHKPNCKVDMTPYNEGGKK